MTAPPKAPQKSCICCSTAGLLPPTPRLAKKVSLHGGARTNFFWLAQDMVLGGAVGRAARTAGGADSPPPVLRAEPSSQRPSSRVPALEALCSPCPQLLSLLLSGPACLLACLPACLPAAAGRTAPLQGPLGPPTPTHLLGTSLSATVNVPVTSQPWYFCRRAGQERGTGRSHAEAAARQTQPLERPWELHPTPPWGRGLCAALPASNGPACALSA